MDCEESRNPELELDVEGKSILLRPKLDIPLATDSLSSAPNYSLPRAPHANESPVAIDVPTSPNRSFDGTKRTAPPSPTSTHNGSRSAKLNASFNRIVESDRRLQRLRLLITKHQLAPLALAFFLFLAVTIPALRIRPFIYVGDGDQGEPYKDTGFLITPDWSGTHDQVNEIYGGIYGFFLLCFCMWQPAGITIVRRILFILTVGQLIQLIQMISTRFPEPNTKLRQTHWVFMMYPLEYATGLLTAQFYCDDFRITAVWYFLSIVGLLLLVPTRYMYTVDVFSALLAGILPFVLYHWYVRTPMSIAKRNHLIKWFEKDVLLVIHKEFQRLEGELVGGSRRSTSSGSRSSGSLGTPLAVLSLGGANVQGRSQGNNTPTLTRTSPTTFDDLSHFSQTMVINVGFENPVTVDFCLQHFHSPSFIGVHQQVDFRDQLVQEVDKMSEEQRRKWLVTSFLAAAIVGGMGAVTTAISTHITNEQRPIGVPLAADLLHPFIVVVPEHTPDIFLYTQSLLVIGWAVINKRRLSIVRRSGFLFGFIMTIRGIVTLATFPPDPSKLCATAVHDEGVTCGDLIFSGHTISFLVTASIVHYYMNNRFVTLLCGIWTSFGLFAVIASRLHYTRDVITAILVGFCTIHLAYVSVFSRPDRQLKSKLLRWFDFDESWRRWRKMKAEQKELLKGIPIIASPALKLPPKRSPGFSERTAKTSSSVYPQPPPPRLMRLPEQDPETAPVSAEDRKHWSTHPDRSASSPPSLSNSPPMDRPEWSDDDHDGVEHRMASTPASAPPVKVLVPQEVVAKDTAEDRDPLHDEEEEDERVDDASSSSSQGSGGVDDTSGPPKLEKNCTAEFR